MNPDGFEQRTRANSVGVDLNRNFPDRFAGRTKRSAPPAHSVEPETEAVMRWTAQHNFVLCANFHGGSVVVNYPFDGMYVRHSTATLHEEYQETHSTAVGCTLQPLMMLFLSK